MARAAGYESRLATVIASTSFPNPNHLFALSVRAAAAEAHQPVSTATQRSRLHSLWKAGATDAPEFLAKTAGMAADPKRVTIPFLSILGGGDSPVFAEQAIRWHAEIPNRLRLVQESSGWIDDILSHASQA